MIEKSVLSLEPLIHPDSKAAEGELHADVVLNVFLRLDRRKREGRCQRRRQLEELEWRRQKQVREVSEQHRITISESIGEPDPRAQKRIVGCDVRLRRHIVACLKQIEARAGAQR